MRRFVLPGVISLIVVALLAVLAFGVSHNGTTSALYSQVSSGHFPVEPSANLALPVLGSGSKTETLADLRGHFVMIDFYAGWCDACQADAGVVASAQKMLRKVGGTVLGVTYQDSSTDASSYLRRYHLNFPVLRDANGDLASAFDVNGVPETFVIGPTGHVVVVRTDQLTKDWVNTSLKQALAQAA